MQGAVVHSFDPNASPPCYRSKDEVIQKDTKVRIEIVGCRVEATDIVSRSVPSRLGSINDVQLASGQRRSSDEAWCGC